MAELDAEARQRLARALIGGARSYTAENPAEARRVWRQLVEVCQSGRRDANGLFPEWASVVEFSEEQLFMLQPPLIQALSYNPLLWLLWVTSLVVAFLGGAALF